MRIANFEWDDGNVAHIVRHAVNPDEIEEVFTNKPQFFKSRQSRYVALGRSFQGRYLFIIFAYQGKGTARVITARDMTVAERRLYKK